MLFFVAVGDGVRVVVCLVLLFIVVAVGVVIVCASNYDTSVVWCCIMAEGCVAGLGGVGWSSSKEASVVLLRSFVLAGYYAVGVAWVGGTAPVACLAVLI